jgi:tripartite-type tricarboxylate transporter receptor subunit TctC
MNAFTVAPDSPFKTMSDLIRAGTSGSPPSVGTSFTAYRLDVEWLASLAGAHFTQVPYKGNANVVADTMGKQLDAGFVDLAAALQLAKAGKVRVLAVAGANRSSELPDVPTMRELGFEGYESAAWIAMFVRAETQPSILGILETAVKKASDSEALNAVVTHMGAQPIQLGSEGMAQFVAKESARYEKLSKAAGIQPE